MLDSTRFIQQVTRFLHVGFNKRFYSYIKWEKARAIDMRPRTSVWSRTQTGITTGVIDCISYTSILMCIIPRRFIYCNCCSFFFGPHVFLWRLLFHAWCWGAWSLTFQFLSCQRWWQQRPFLFCPSACHILWSNNGFGSRNHLKFDLFWYRSSSICFSNQNYV